MSSPRLFTRQASGLVREISAFSTFVYNAYSINPILTLAFMLLVVPAFHPSASMVWAVIITTVVVLPMAFVYAMLSIAMPRSGGDYVYISRILHPALGFMANWNATIWFAFYLGAPCVLFGKYGLAALFRGVGVKVGSPALLAAANWSATPWGGFIIGTFLLAALSLMYVLSLRHYLRLQTAFFLVSLLGIGGMLVLLFTSSHNMFVGQFNAYIHELTGTSDAYAHILQDAAKKGFQAATASWHETLLILVWPYLGLCAGFISAYFGGEVRNSSRSQRIAIPGAILFSGLLMVLLLLGVDRVMTNGFLGAVGFVPSTDFGLSFTPVFGEFVALLTNNLVVLSLVAVGFALWTYVWAPVNILIITRNLLAWSMDRVMPERVSAVSGRWHSPVTAILICAVVSEVCVALYAFLPAFTLLTGIFGLSITFLLTSVAAVAFPYRKRPLFESSSVRSRLANVPVISILGCLSILATLGMMASTLLDPVSGISFDPHLDAGAGAGLPFIMFLINVGVLLSGAVVYYVAMAIQRRRGIDIALAYKELPPE
jgi:basic amino acid/polyamine antiporter, APA family